LYQPVYPVVPTGLPCCTNQLDRFATNKVRKFQIEMKEKELNYTIFVLSLMSLSAKKTRSLSDASTPVC